jgi:hypothetical protein
MDPKSHHKGANAIKRVPRWTPNRPKGCQNGYQNGKECFNRNPFAVKRKKQMFGIHLAQHFGIKTIQNAIENTSEKQSRTKQENMRKGFQKGAEVDETTY